jgi:hypothetical protein
LTLWLFAWAAWLNVGLGHSFVGVFNRRLDAIFVSVLRKWRDDWNQRRWRRTTEKS